MKTHSLLRILVSLAAALLLPACENPYIIHNLERPVRLTGIEIRSNVISADDPSHPLNEVFKEGRSEYTVTIPYDAVDITVAAFPEEGAQASYEVFHHIDLWQSEIEFTIEANKAHRLSTLYTIKVLRGKPEAQLAGIELFVSDDSDPNNFEKYEKSNFIVNYIPSRGSYQVKVPNYTKHVALVLRSFNSPDKMVFSVDYRFQTRDYASNDSSKVTIGADGHTPGGDYYQNENTVPIMALPSWWPGLHDGETEISLGGIHIYPGTGGIYFGVPADFNDPDPDSKGKLAYISLTARANNLDPKEYVLELRKERDYAYLGEINIYKQTAGSPPVTETVNRLIGNFAPSVLSYDAALPKDADKVVIAPVFERHTASAGNKTIEYVRYYYDSDGKRYYIPDDKYEHILNAAAPVPADPAWTDDYIYGLSDKLKKTDDAPVEFAFDVQNYGIYKSMEVILRVEADGKLTNPNPYRVMARRQTAKAVLSNIEVLPGVLVNNAWDSSGLSGFEANKQVYTVIAGSGRTHARINLRNTEGTQDRTITISSSSKTVNFHLEGGAWEDDDPSTSSFNAVPSADIELKNRNTVVKITVSDTPSSYSTQEYTINILSKNRNDIILPSDADSDGRMRAVFASGGDAGLTATSALPGDLIELTVEANLGYYVKLGRNTDGYKNGVHCKAEGFSMNDLSLVSSSSDKKHRKYRFNMPDSNVEFKAEYEETAVAQNRIAYVAPRGVGLANRGGGYGTGKDADGKLPGTPGFDKTTATATSWGRASWDLQAVINSYDGDDPDHFTEIWLLEGTYRVPDPGDYTNAYYSSSDPGYKGESNPAFDCFPVDSSGGPGNYKAGSPSSYHVQKYNISGIQNKKDLAFVLRNGVQMYGGFKETDTDTENRHGQATETILTGVFADGETQAHHVVIMADTSAIMDGLTISGGLGPELDDSHVITVKNNDANTPVSRTIARQYGAGIHNVNSGLILTNVNIRSNTATRGGGMYTDSGTGVTTMLRGVEFFSNTALANGGGMYTQSGSVRVQSRESTWSFFSQNMAVSSGGALYNGSGSRLSVNNTEFFANSAQTGGGVYIAGNSSPVDPLDPPSFVNVRIRSNGASGSGAGIFNAAEMNFINVDFTNNYALGGSGGGLYNTGTAYLSNTSFVANSGGALYNTNTALLVYTAITGNNGSGINNNGKLILTNSIVNGNTGNGVNTSSQAAASASALLTNVTIAGNGGDGVSNRYEGMGDSGQFAQGHADILLTNVRVTGNGGRGIYNRYSRFSGRGINLTLVNCTVASNVTGGVRTEKSIGTATNQGPYFGHSLYNETEPNRMTFPVYIRFHNSVIWGNGGVGVGITGGSDWFINTNPAIRAGVNASSLGVNQGAPAEVYEHSLIQGKPLYNGADPYEDHARAEFGNLDGNQSYSGLFASLPSPGKSQSGDFTPGSVLIGAANSTLYPKNAADLTGDIFWKLIADSKHAIYGSQYPYNNGGLESLLDTKHQHWINGAQPPLRTEVISHFLQYDNSFNVGDLRNNNWLEPSPAKSRYSGGSLDIGAYQR